MADHRRHARRPVWPTWASPTSGPSATTTRLMTRSRSTRSPTGRSIAPARRCDSSSGSRARATISPTPPISPASRSTSRSRIPKVKRSSPKSFTADKFGGFDGSFELPSDAALGVYQVYIPRRGGGSFRVEEYKKPEFEVTVAAPARPVMLGEKVAATIKANYYFGGPVAEAKVKYKITRTTADERWYPAARWDWLFGPGYWWFAADSLVVPRLVELGHAPAALAGGGADSQAPPEVVAEAELPIRPDGTLPVEIDTALAKAAHPDHDHRYEITAEITDQSRRTIVGTGTVLVARKPFSVYTWVDRGHYRAGDTIEAGVSAQTLDRKPVTGKGTLKLLKIAYDARAQAGRDARGKLGPRPGRRWAGPPGDQGRGPGQYRISATIDDGQGHPIEGGYLLTITGPGFDSASFRYNDLEIIPERKEYQPGETLRLLINTNQVNSTVLLFVRPSDGVYLPPKVDPLARQEHGRGDRHRPPRHAQHVRRGPDGLRRQGARRGTRDRHSARVAHRADRDRAVSNDLQARRESQGQAQAHRARRQAVRWARPSSPSTTRPSSTSRAARMSRRSRRSSGTGSGTTNRKPSRASTDGFNNLTKPNEIAMQDLGAFGEIAPEPWTTMRAADSRSKARGWLPEG